MNLLAALLSALRALGTNWLRSMLTMLGIIIGVAAVITMIAIGGGARQRVEQQIKALGTNIMLVLPGAMTSGGVRLGAQTGQTLTEEDARAIAAEVPEVQAAAASLRSSTQVVGSCRSPRPRSSSPCCSRSAATPTSRRARCSPRWSDGTS